MRSRAVALLLLALVTPAVAGTHLRKPRRGFQMRVHDFTVRPGEDLEVCQYARLPNRRAIDVNGFELKMPPEAHHFVIWSYGGDVTDDARFPRGPVESVACSGLSPDEVIPQVLIPIQTPDARLRFPDGVALRLDPRKQVWLNPHLKNFTGDPIKPDIRFNFYRARKGTVRHYAHGLIIGNTGKIAIPAGGDQTLTAEWTAPVPVTLIQLATHQHKLGTYASIEIVAPDGVTRTRIYENADWQHPRPLWPNPSIRLEKGQKMRITCRWHNPGDHTVYFGPETTDEMCFILGFYYRDDGDNQPVTGSGCLASKDGLLCPLAPAVSE